MTRAKAVASQLVLVTVSRYESAMSMTRLLVSVIFVGIVFSANAAQATGITTGSQVKLLNSTGSLGGGPFGVDGPDAGNEADFLTFCLEINEFINYNTLYYVNIAENAVAGGAGGGGLTGDPLDSKTAYLYAKFLMGTLSGYDANDVASRNGLQLAIWLIEQEVYEAGGEYYRTGTTTKVGGGDVWDAADAFFADASANAVPGNLYGVRVMQLWTGYDATSGAFTGNKQDQLIFVSEATTTASLVALGILVLGAARVRFGTL